MRHRCGSYNWNYPSACNQLAEPDHGLARTLANSHKLASAVH